ncbi:MAG: hypothetical protein LBQ58_02805 [Synergistaceae bacterium]|nr:hypothetical protein [Synergistaceae bacterium]
MRRKEVILYALLLCSLLASRLYAADNVSDWDVSAEIKRLYREAPSLAAFPDVDGVVWMSSYNYTLMPDGAMRRIHRFLILLGNETNEGMSSRKIPRPSDEGAVMDIIGAAWYNPSTGEKMGDLARESYDADGIKGEIVVFPDSAQGRVVAVETVVSAPGRYFLDDVLTLAGELPIWEQTISVEIPDGINLYWEGFGVREPERRENRGAEIITWTVMNQPVWRNSGVLDERCPTLIFSLQHGLMTHLKNLKEMENLFRAPSLPAAISSSRGNLSRAVASLAAYMSTKLIPPDEYEPSLVRDNSYISDDGPWTAWEQVIIASKWMTSMGFDARLFWAQTLPVGSDGPTSYALWREPVLKIADNKGNEIFFKSSRTEDFEKLHPSLYGAVIYRANGANLERLALPRGSASDHQILQMWKLSIDEMGIATGTLDLTVTGAWVDILSLYVEPTLEYIGPLLLENIYFNMPGLSVEPRSLKALASGYRVNFDVRAALGIVSGNDILFRIPGGIPNCFRDIPDSGSKYSFKFPFVFEQNSIISTPKNYRVLSLPGKVQIGDSKAMLEGSVVHWTKKGQAEAMNRWTVRSSSIDEYLSGRVSEQLAIVSSWSELTVPLRK